MAELNSTGTTLNYGTYLGGVGQDAAYAIAVDSAGNAYLTGYAGSADFPVTSGALQTNFGAGSFSAFIAKVNLTGTALSYSTFLTGANIGLAIAVDGVGNAYVTGPTRSTNLPTTVGAFQTSLAAGSNDAFVTKLNATGTALLYCTYLGGNGNDDGNAIAVDQADNAYIAGDTTSTNLPITAGAVQATYNGGLQDGFLAKLNATGTAVLYGSYLGGAGNDIAQGVALDGSGGVYVTGPTDSTNFPITPGAFQTSVGTSTRAFVSKLAFPTIAALSPNATIVGGAGFTLTIDGSNFDPAATVLWNATLLTVTSRTGSTEIQATVPAALIAGVNSVSVTVDNPGPVASTAATFTINPIASTTTVSLSSDFAGGSVTYDGHSHGALASWASAGSDGAGGSLPITYFGINGTNYAPTTAPPTNAGSYEASASFVGDATHAASSGVRDFTINPLAVTLSGSRSYDGTVSAAAAILSITDMVGGDQVSLASGSATLAAKTAGPEPITNAAGLALAGTAAGNYTVTGASGSVTIAQVGSTALVSWIDGASASYNGSPHVAAASWISSGPDGEHGPLTVTYVGINGTAYGPTSAAPTNSGNYEASASFAGDTNHTASSGVRDFAINRVSATSTETFNIFSVAKQPSANLPIDNDFTRFANAFADIRAGDTVQIHGTLDWSEANALASWKATGEAYALPHVNGITATAASPGDGVHGPGDDPTLSGEGPFYFDGLGTDQSWNITGLTISNFDTAFFYSPETNVTDYAGTHLTNNTITVPSANPGAQNGGILLGPSPNQTVQGNTINVTAGGGASSASFGISSFTFGGNGAWNNLLLDNNTVSVTTTGASGKVIGIAENSGSVGSNIAVTNNTFNGDSGSLAGNQQVAFGITSQNSATGAVVYTGNKVNGARDGFVWGDPEASPAYDFTGAQYVPIAFSNTTLTNVGTGFVARDGGKAILRGTTITNSAAFNFGTAFAADGAGSVITVADPTTNFTGVSSLKKETNAGQVIFLNDAATIQNVGLAEGNSGFTLFSFPVMLAVAPGANQMFTVDYSTANGTADGNDYNTANGTLTFQPGQASATIAVKVLGDFTPEPDETFFVNLSNPILTTNGSPAPGHLTSTQATGTIQNDDSTTIAASIADAAATKSATMGAQTLMTFAATLNSAPPAGDYFTVNYHATNGSARGNVDYSAPDGTLTFLAGSTTPLSPLTVTVIGSPAMNPPETFTVTLDTPLLHFTGFSQTIPGNLGNGTATGTIDSPPPSGAVVSVSSVSKPEGTPIAGNSASNFTTFTFTISYTGTLTTSIKVNWQTANGSALGGQDYQQNSGQVTLTPTVTSQSISVTVFADKTFEPNENFFVNLTNPGLSGFSNYTLGTATGVGTIVNDD